ncbi:MurR/RpiR family transcriptional regulator [Paenibacillus protaetiae]|uniref:MurR/RpiR family transcriptional regulator n=1 Tax=Paenibacillus protaetiae TaxID=2509456 RepID=A0A4P6ES64_9BACL|nr:MurR/RpiR family transcriptional regulator [Paenibacillus protaetiae]QAY65275.1 MurR/RpiR family transcriptional regulator [Paenibacillus protaetiae]
MDHLFANRRFTRGHQRIADYISKKIEDIPFMVEEDLAAACQVSVSTVSRFWSEIEFKNLKEFKQHVKDEILLSPSRKLQSAFAKADEGSRAETNIMATAGYLRGTIERLKQEQFDAAVSLLGEARVVHIYGPGSAESLAALMDFRLTRFGVPVHRLTKGGHELFDSLIHIKKQDVIVIFGFVSESPEMAVLFDFAKERGCKTLLITDLLVSGMLEKADVPLYTARGELWEFHSMVAPIAMIESLIVAVGKQRDTEAIENGDQLHEIRRRYQKWLPKKI